MLCQITSQPPNQITQLYSRRSTQRMPELQQPAGSHSAPCPVSAEFVAATLSCRQGEDMKKTSLLQRLGNYLLGLVDEYWAMRRPWQYGNKQPQCGLQCDGDHCQRSD